MTPRICLIIFSLALILCNQPIFGAVITEYTFASGSPNPTNVASNLTAGNFTVGSGLSGSVFDSGGWVYGNGGIIPNTEALSISGNEYFSFTLTPDGGSALTITSFTFGTAYYTTDAGSAGSTNYLIRSSEDNFASNITSFLSVSGQGPTTSPTFTTRTVTLSSSYYQTQTSPITFRIYLYDSVTAATRMTAVNNVIINGSVIPEPSTAGLFLIGSGYLIWRKRRSLHS